MLAAYPAREIPSRVAEDYGMSVIDEYRKDIPKLIKYLNQLSKALEQV